jgi:hypothetical protein
MRLVPVISAIAILGAAACTHAQAPLAPLSPGGHHVLFIGNSLTYVNDLPRTLSDLASSVGDTIKTAMVAKPDYALEDHISDGGGPKAIALGGWEFVVLQQGPSSLTENRQNLIAATQYYDRLIRQVGGRTALYMVWPAVQNFSSFAAVAGSYLQAAQAVGGVFMGAGLAWEAAWEKDPSVALYGSDGLHPSPLGTYLAALVMYERITGKDARTLPGRAVVEGRTLDTPEATIRVLQNAAHRVNTDPSVQPAVRD